MKRVLGIALVFVLTVIAVLMFVYSPVLHAQSGHSIIISWTNPTTGTPPTSVDIFRGTTAGGESTTALANVPNPGTTFSDTTGIAGTTYFYVVKEKNQFGSSAASNEASALFLGNAPGPAVGLGASAQ